MPKGGNPKFPDAADNDGGQTLKSRPEPLPAHPGIIFYARETLAVDNRHNSANTRQVASLKMISKRFFAEFQAVSLLAHKVGTASKSLLRQI